MGNGTISKRLYLLSFLPYYFIHLLVFSACISYGIISASLGLYMREAENTDILLMVLYTNLFLER